MSACGNGNGEPASQPTLRLCSSIGGKGVPKGNSNVPERDYAVCGRPWRHVRSDTRPNALATAAVGGRMEQARHGHGAGNMLVLHTATVVVGSRKHTLRIAAGGHDKPPDKIRCSPEDRAGKDRGRMKGQTARPGRSSQLGGHRCRAALVEKGEAT